MALPFDDGAFDCVVCQFGAMFFPDKVRAFAETRRVLAPGGVFLFNVWDRIEENDFANVILQELAALFPQDPPRFMARTPHGYHDVAAVRRDVMDAGFASPQIETVAARSVAPSPLEPAMAYCQGTPWRSEIEARGSLVEATQRAARALEERFGPGPVDGKIQAHVVTAERG
jgi:SAM-dependent methyltransferase